MTVAIDLAPPAVQITVLEGEPSELRLPITDDAGPVDVAADYPSLVTRLVVGDGAAQDIAVAVEDTNVLVATIPALTAGARVFWELRDADADVTWLTARVRVEVDRVPQ